MCYIILFAQRNTSIYSIFYIPASANIFFNIKEDSISLFFSSALNDIGTFFSIPFLPTTDGILSTTSLIPCPDHRAEGHSPRPHHHGVPDRGEGLRRDAGCRRTRRRSYRQDLRDLPTCAEARCHPYLSCHHRGFRAYAQGIGQRGQYIGYP